MSKSNSDWLVTAAFGAVALLLLAGGIAAAFQIAG